MPAASTSKAPQNTVYLSSTLNIERCKVNNGRACRRVCTPSRLGLEQAGWFGRPIPAVNNQLLALHRSTAAAHVVLDAGCIHLEAGKHSPDAWMVIQAQDGLALQLGHQLSHLLVLSEFKLYPIAGRLPVRRVQVKQRMRPVVPSRHRPPPPSTWRW